MQGLQGGNARGSHGEGNAATNDGSSEAGQRAAGCVQTLCWGSRNQPPSEPLQNPTDREHSAVAQHKGRAEPETPDTGGPQRVECMMDGVGAGRASGVQQIHEQCCRCR